MRNLLLLAPPAAGKGTQAQLLEKTYGIVPISTGNLLRQASKRGDAFGKKIDAILKSGALVEDAIMIDLLREQLQALHGSPFLLDGFPRTVAQAKALDALLEEAHTSLDYVFLLEVPKDVLEKRIIGRRICEVCGTVYNVHQKDAPSLCHCGGSLVTRSDDTKAAYQIRYGAYLNSTYPLVEYYEAKNLLYRIDANRSIEEVFASISAILNRGEKHD